MSDAGACSWSVCGGLAQGQARSPSRAAHRWTAPILFNDRQRREALTDHLCRRPLSVGVADLDWRNDRRDGKSSCST